MEDEILIISKKEKDFLEINKISIKLKEDHVYEQNIIKSIEKKINVRTLIEKFYRYIKLIYLYIKLNKNKFFQIFLKIETKF